MNYYYYIAHLINYVIPKNMCISQRNRSMLPSVPVLAGYPVFVYLCPASRLKYERNAFFSFFNEKTKNEKNAFIINLDYSRQGQTSSTSIIMHFAIYAKKSFNTSPGRLLKHLHKKKIPRRNRL